MVTVMAVFQRGGQSSGGFSRNIKVGEGTLNFPLILELA